MRYYYVHVPNWYNDSEVGSFSTLEAAQLEVAAMHTAYNVEACIHVRTVYTLPFGWRLTRVRTVE